MEQLAQPFSPQPISGLNFLPCLSRPQTSRAIMKPNMKNPPGVWARMRMVYSSGMICLPSRLPAPMSSRTTAMAVSTMV